jgi:uncharacterized protein (DUF433 family)
MSAVVDAIPLAKDQHGVYRVGGTRVTLDLLIRAFKRGCNAEEIAQMYPAVELSDVYHAIGYYLGHRAETDAYLERREREEQELLAAHPEWSPIGLRNRLLDRRTAQ